MELDAHINRFRIATRELFNHFFRVDDPYNNGSWVLEERYEEVESLLFEKLVLEPAELPLIPYGTLQPNIRVNLRGTGGFVPIMLNREVDSGYWDYPLKEVTREAKLAFISFFDWDQLDYRDHRYVRAQVIERKSQPEIVGKHAFIETHYVCFAKG
ncbi:MAG: hypothetical protein H6940_03455 [Burkholderiales bacterium]|nr:hypothetical protein [Burkholderiales bacterium]